MKRILILALASMAAASQAVVFSFVGTTTTGAVIPGSFTSTGTSAGSGDSLNAFTSAAVTINSTASSAVFGSGANTLTVSFNGTTDDTSTGGTSALSSTGYVSAATGSFAQYLGSSSTQNLTVTSNTIGSVGFNAFTVVGNINATPEPASLAALGVGAVALVRRRRKV